MASPPESPIEEVVYELEQTRVPKPIPVALEDLCRQTKFTKQEIRVMYRGFKTVTDFFHTFPLPFRSIAIMAITNFSSNSFSVFVFLFYFYFVFNSNSNDFNRTVLF